MLEGGESEGKAVELGLQKQPSNLSEVALQTPDGDDNKIDIKPVDSEGKSNEICEDDIPTGKSARSLSHANTGLASLEVCEKDK